MNALWNRVRWRVAVVAATLLWLLALIGREGAWAWVGIEHYSLYFVDTMAVLSAGQAWHAGLDIYQNNPFDPFGRPHVYGPWWLLTGPMGLTIADAFWIGPLLGMAFLVAAAAVLGPRRPAAAGVAWLLLASPQVLLALERGNNDLVVFILLALAGGLLARPRGPALFGVGLFGLAAALKMYPLAALPALVARPVPRRAALLWLGVGAGGCLLVFLLWRTDFTRALATAPRPWSVFTYGLKVLSFMWMWQTRPRAILCLAVVFGAALAGVAVWLRRRAATLWVAVPTTGTVAAWFVAGGSSWCFCYLANTNYVYRASLLLLPARLWLDQMNGPDRPVARAARELLAACIVTLWLFPLKSWCSGHLGPSSPADLGLAVILGLEQALVIAVTAALLISLTGWLWRRLRARPADSASPAPSLCG